MTNFLQLIAALIIVVECFGRHTKNEETSDTHTEDEIFWGRVLTSDALMPFDSMSIPSFDPTTEPAIPIVTKTTDETRRTTSTATPLLATTTTAVTATAPVETTFATSPVLTTKETSTIVVDSKTTTTTTADETTNAGPTTSTATPLLATNTTAFTTTAPLETTLAVSSELMTKNTPATSDSKTTATAKETAIAETTSPTTPLLATNTTAITTTTPLETTPAGPPCPIEVTTGCTGGKDQACDEIVAPKTQCVDDPPTLLEMRYNGGSCEQKDNIQSSQYMCNEPLFGPPTTGSVYVEIHNEGKPCFSGMVNVGDIITVSDGGRTLSRFTYVNIYDEPEGSLYQSITIITDCSDSDPLRLQDMFGSLQLTSFENEEQGFVGSVKNAFLSFTIQNVGDEEGVYLRSLVSRTNQDFTIDLTDEVRAKGEIRPDETLVFSSPFVVDMSTGQVDYIFRTMVSISTEDGDECQSFDAFSFVAGAGAALPQLNNPRSLGIHTLLRGPVKSPQHAS